MKYGVIITLILGLIVSAYFSAQSHSSFSSTVQNLRLDMTLAQVNAKFGAPLARNRNNLTYVLSDSSLLTVTLRDEKVASATMKLHHPLKIEAPEMKSLTLVQMDSNLLTSDRPSWFYAGKPEDGLIYKITADGTVESVTWVPAFTYSHNQPKQLQALFRDFHNQKETVLR
jgi:hypothetical protein